MSEAYMEAVRAADEYVGEIMDKLESMGHLGATTVIILSDHGGLEFDHGDPVPEVLLIPAESMDARSEEGRPEFLMKLASRSFRRRRSPSSV
jgi:arylsulfatase A-like enzyme